MKQPSPRQRDALALVADGKFYPDLVKEDDGWHAFCARQLRMDVPNAFLN